LPLITLPADLNHFAAIEICKESANKSVFHPDVVVAAAAAVSVVVAKQSMGKLNCFVS